MVLSTSLKHVTASAITNYTYNQHVSLNNQLPIY